MGLDMYLTGSKFFPNFKVERPVDIDGDQIQLLEVSLGYWRKFGLSMPILWTPLRGAWTSASALILKRPTWLL
jgi:hypothetical protein